MSNGTPEDRDSGRKRLSRRQFLKGAMVVGVSGTVAACAQPSTPAPTTAPKAAPPAAATAAPAAAATTVPAVTKAAAATPTKIRVGWTIAPHQGLIGVGLVKGWFKEAGLDIELTNFDTGAPLFEAMGAGKLDIGMSGSTPPITIASSNVVPTYFMGTHAESTNLFTIISRKAITTPADVKGKIALTAKGSVNHYFLDLMLDKYGLSEKDITLIHMEQVDAVTAFVANQGDFASLGTAFWPQIMSKSPDTKVLFTGGDLAGPGGKPMQARLMEVMTVQKEFADKNTDAVARYLDVLTNRIHGYFNDASTKTSAHTELADWLKKTINFNQSVDDLGKLLSPCTYYSAAEQVKLFGDGTFKASIDAQANYLVDTNRIKQAVNFDQWGNVKLMEAAAKLKK